MNALFFLSSGAGLVAARKQQNYHSWLAHPAEATNILNAYYGSSLG